MDNAAKPVLYTGGFCNNHTEGNSAIASQSAAQTYGAHSFTRKDEKGNGSLLLQMAEHPCQSH